MHEYYYPKSPIICRGPLATAVLKVDTLKSSPILFWGVVDYALADRLHIGFLLHPSRGECTGESWSRMDRGQNSLVLLHEGTKGERLSSVDKNCRGCAIFMQMS